MSAMTLDLPRRFPWPTLLSVAIHGAVVAGLLYTSVHQVIEKAFAFTANRNHDGGAGGFRASAGGAAGR